jgi:aminoglycoside/choline kinase family phosphotransferase
MGSNVANVANVTMCQHVEHGQDARFSLVQHWLAQDADWANGQLTPLMGDASFRRYFRWQRDGRTAMVMDAPPDRENIRTFLQVQQRFQQLDVSVPSIYRYDSDLGLMLLQDFGDHVFAQAVSQADEAVVDAYYRQAMTLLADWQCHPSCDTVSASLPWYDHAHLTQEMQLLPDWLLSAHLSAPLTRQEQGAWQQWQAQLVTSALTQPSTLVHRDYHSRNLMVTDQGYLGVIDFQDAVQGALLYDVVSLLRDAYLVWPEDQVREWLRFYFLTLVSADKISRQEWSAFERAFDWMGLQRHFKVLGIFSRLAHRDDKPRYLADLPVVAGYAFAVARRYPDLIGMADWLEQRVLSSLLN